MASTALDIITGALANLGTRVGCVEWTRAKNAQGYGVVSLSGKTVLVHRMAWVLEHGDIPPGLCVLHTCDNPPCFNVKHLFLGTRADNLADMRRKGRQQDYKNCKGSGRGSLNPNAKLTESQVIEIRGASGTQNEIAKRYGISRGAVKDIRLRRRWRHVIG